MKFLHFFSRHKLADQKTRKSLGREEFRLLHYAGEVTYSVAGKCVLTCIISALSHSFFLLSSPALWIKTALLGSKDKSGYRVVLCIIWLTRLISHLKFLPCCEISVERWWQPEWFLFLPGFLDKNNDLLFRNLKEVSMDAGYFQYSAAEQGAGFKMGWHLRKKVLLISTWRMHVLRAALWKGKLKCSKFVLLKTKQPKTILSHCSKSSLKFILYFISENVSLHRPCATLRILS